MLLDSAGQRVPDPRDQIALVARFAKCNPIPAMPMAPPRERSGVELKLIAHKAVTLAYEAFREARAKHDGVFASVKGSLNPALTLADNIRTIRRAKTADGIVAAAREAVMDKPTLDVAAGRARALLIESANETLIPTAQKLIEVAKETLATIRADAAKAEDKLFSAWFGRAKPTAPLSQACDECERRLDELGTHVREALGPKVRGLRTWFPPRNFLHAVDSFFAVE
ncbi:MAG TPA: hypothetical protein PKM43_21835 [Verrucomicrobiota bacterium]|nr:hypothetical protein [Verrucomicrobiota bacterium]